MDLTITNRAMQAMGGFAIQFNKNSFGVSPTALQVQTPLPPNQSAQTSLLLTTSKFNVFIHLQLNNFNCLNAKIFL